MLKTSNQHQTTTENETLILKTLVRNNSFYTHNIDSTIEELSSFISSKEIVLIFNKHYNNTH